MPTPHDQSCARVFTKNGASVRKKYFVTFMNMYLEVEGREIGSLMISGGEGWVVIYIVLYSEQSCQTW